MSKWEQIWEQNGTSVSALRLAGGRVTLVGVADTSRRWCLVLGVCQRLPPSRTFSSKPGHWRHYTVEEFIEGQDFQDILVAGKPWQIKAVAEFFAKICDSLTAMRGKGNRSP